MTIASLFTKGRGSYVCVLNDQEEAGYFYHDLMQLTASNEVYFFPSAYRRAIKYGHVDPANEILRTEVLSRLQDPDASFVIVTYPDALAERVVAREVLKENTLKISVGEKLDNMFVSDVLDEYGFEQVDYVYEPGQYALRGSILDVFSFSYEFPYRIDFFGDEVETIRTFDVETQLSKEKLDSIYIVPEMSKNAKDSTSLLGSLPRNTCIAARDLSWCKERIGSAWNDDPVVADEESFADIDQMLDQIRKLKPYLQASGELATTADGKINAFEYLQNPQQLAKYELLSNCIACGTCEGSCPVYAGGEAFIGPAALIAASRLSLIHISEPTRP